EPNKKNESQWIINCTPQKATITNDSLKPPLTLNAMWLLFQCVVMIAVGWTGIYYEWTPNPVALGIVCVGAAWLATKIVSALPTLWRIFRKLLAFAQKRSYMSGTDMERQGEAQAVLANPRPSYWLSRNLHNVANGVAKTRL